jgi:hypothetical protein
MFKAVEEKPLGRFPKQRHSSNPNNTNCFTQLDSIVTASKIYYYPYPTLRKEDLEMAKPATIGIVRAT